MHRNTIAVTNSNALGFLPFHQPSYSQGHVGAPGMNPSASTRMSFAGASSLPPPMPNPTQSMVFSTPVALPSEAVIDKLLEMYYKDPVNAVEILKLDLFCASVALPNTVFEEVETFNNFEQSYTLNEEDLNDKQYNTTLRKAVRRLVVQAMQENDKLSPLAAFHLMLYKRIQILDKVQEFQQLKSVSVKKQKTVFESLPLYAPGTQKEENIALVKNLQKAMQKSDVKKGLFAKLRKSRSEAVYKLLSKHTGPLTMATHSSDLTTIRDYLLQYSVDLDNNRKRRSKSLMSLMLLSMSRGSLLDMLLVLHSTLTFSRIKDGLSTDSSEDGGIFLRPEILKGMQQYQKAVQDLVQHQPKPSRPVDPVLRQFEPEEILKKADYQIPSSAKKCTEVRRVFVFTLAHLDLLAQRAAVNNSSKKKTTLNSEFIVETLPQTFELIIDLLGRLMRAPGDGQHTDEYGRLYSMVALFRILKINIESLILWRKDNENVDSLATRMLKAFSIATSTPMAANNSTDNFMAKVKKFLLSVLSAASSKEKPNIEVIPSPSLPDNPIQPAQPAMPTVPGEFFATKPAKKQQQLKDDTKLFSSMMDFSELQEDDFVLISKTEQKATLQNPTTSHASQSSTTPSGQINLGDAQFAMAVCGEIATIISTGFTLFYPTFQEQMTFMTESLKNLRDPNKKLLLTRMLQKLNEDTNLFDSFMIQGLGFRDVTVEFLREIVRFVKVQTMRRLQKVTIPQVTTEDISQLCMNFVLLWQNSLLRSISSTLVRYKKSTFPTVPLGSGVGKVLIEYAGLILETCIEILKKANERLSTAANPNEKQAIEQILKRSTVGWLLLPLLQGYSKMLWKYGSTKQDAQQMDSITSYLFPYITDLLQATNTLNLSIQDEKNKHFFEWKLVETDHPYESNLNEKVDIRFSGNDVAFVAIKFDPRCRTAHQADNLRISSSSTKSITQSLQFAGYGNTIPVNPLVTWGNNMTVNFMSGDKHTDWGMRCGVFPIMTLQWTYELEKTIAWLGGRCASYVLSSVPCTPEELSLSSWLSSKLFAGGLDSESMLSAEESVDSFLLDLVYNRKTAKSLVAFMDHQMRLEMALTSDADALLAERGLIAACLKHLDLGGYAMNFAKLIEDSKQRQETEEEPVVIPTPQKLRLIWKNVRPIRQWMMQSKQTTNVQFAQLREQILQKMTLLLKLRCGTSTLHEQKSEEYPIRLDLQESTVSPSKQESLPKKSKLAGHIQTVNSKNESSSTIDVFQKMRHAVTVWRCFRRWKDRVFNFEHASKSIKDVATQVLQFAQSDVQPAVVYQVIKVRAERASARARSFQMLTELISSTKYASVKAEIVASIRDSLKSKSLKKDKAVDFHYCNNIEGCGPAVYDMMTDSFAGFLTELISDIDPLESDVVLTGLLREVLETCFISFKPFDVEWVLGLDFLQKLCPLMYDSNSQNEAEKKVKKEEENVAKFKEISSNVQEKKEVTARAWKIFRLLSIRCVEILEDWETNEKFQIPVTKRGKIRNQLDTLKDRIFTLLFDELETMIKQNTLLGNVLEEMLSLMVSLCSTESAQQCLLSARFQKLLLPMLKLGFPKVQELSLQLCGQLILGLSTSNEEEATPAPSPVAENTEDTDVIMGVLFDFLGSYEIRQIVGRDAYSSTNSPISVYNARQVFFLLRRLLEPKTPQHWRNAMNKMLTQYITRSSDIANSIMESAEISSTIAEEAKNLLATLTVLIGFPHIPDRGDKIKVFLNGRWEDATIKSIEEHRHAYKVEIKKGKDGANIIKCRVYAEDTKLPTEEVLDSFEISSPIIQTLCSLVEAVGSTIFLEQSMSTATNLVLVNIWTKTMKIIKEWISQNEPAKVAAVLLNKLSAFTNFVEKPTNIKYGKRLLLNSCSYAFTGKQFTRQYYYSCITCGMSNTRAVCAFCAKTCHRGHRLGTPEIGEFYCDCGAGEGKTPCKSLKHGPEDRTPCLARCESLALRLNRIMPLCEEAKNEQNGSLMSASSGNLSVDQKDIGPSKFVLPNNRSGYSIDSTNENISFVWSSASGFSMIGTDYPIPTHAQGFYFEIEINNLTKTREGITLGITELVNSNCAWPDVLDKSCAYNLTTGNLYYGKAMFKVGYGPVCVKGDVIGCGYNKQQRTVFFTKNGAFLGNAFTINAEGRVFYPMIILAGDNTSVRTNLGQRSYKFDVASRFGNSIPTTRVVTPTQSVHVASIGLSRKKMQEELESLGFPSKEVEQAINSFPKDVNAAAASLYKSKSRPIRQQLADQLLQMGFTDRREDCLLALKMNSDDLMNAANWLIDGGLSTAIAERMADEKEDDENDKKGMHFAGADISKPELDALIVRGMLQNPEVEVNENAFSDTQFSKVSVGDIVVISPYMLDDLKSGATTSRSRGTIGTVVKKLVTAVVVQTIDPSTGGVSISVINNSSHLLLPPDELRDVKVNDLSDVMFSYSKSIGVLHCRSLLKEVISKVSSLSSSSIANTWHKQLVTPQNAYKLLKSMFVEQHQLQDHNFTANTPVLSENLSSLLQSCKQVKLGEDKSLFDFVAEEAMNDVKQFSETLPNYRRIIFKQEMNNQRIPLKFWGASSLCLTFVGRCELTSASDMLTFYYDQQGRKKAKQFKGPLLLPKRAIITGDKIWYEFNTTSVAEGFQFYITPSTFKLDEYISINQPNIALASLVLRNLSESYWKNPQAISKAFDACLKFVMTPFAPFKGAICEALSLIARQIPVVAREVDPSLPLLKQFRLELEDTYQEFLKYHEKEPYALPAFHSLIDLMSIIRQSVMSDLCTSVFPQNQQQNPAQQPKHHMYMYQEGYSKTVKTCTSCATCVPASYQPKYFAQDESKCQSCTSKNFKWRPFTNLFSAQYSSPYDYLLRNNNLVPIETLAVNPSDWFEHVSWVDQLAIVRQLCESFVEEGPLPDWVLFETALETKKKVSYRESPHPYHVVKDSGQIQIAGAKTLFVSFDKHSKTHKCDRLYFSAKEKGGDDLGSYGGEELRDKTIVVHGNKLFYTFKSAGGDHDCACNNCGVRIAGIRFHCTECDDYDLCQRCVKKKVHTETHLFLKIRRPVDCVPASLPHLYTNKWMNTTAFRGNVHLNVKCNACGMNPIRGVRYWCENCEDFNLCEKCAEDEYMHHDRMHVFLRVIKPLPPKSQMPANALPYGLVYEKDLDTHWGYLFSVSSSDSAQRYDDPDIIGLMDEIKGCMQEWNRASDEQLVDYIENYCNGWQSLEHNGLSPTPQQLLKYNLIAPMKLKSVRYRFIVLKLLNRKISRILSLLDLGNGINLQPSRSTIPATLSSLICSLRQRIFRSVKMDAWQHSVQKALVDINPIGLKLNRTKAAEETNNKEAAQKNSVFMQTYKQVQAFNPKVLSRKNGAWKVTLIGESADDYGGPFREALTQACTELESEQICLFTTVPNQKSSSGENREKWMPNPSCISPKHLKWYKFVGLMLGIGLLSKTVLPMDLPSLFWKCVVREDVDLRDLESIDAEAYNGLLAFLNPELKKLDESTWEYSMFDTFTCVGADGSLIELKKGGKDQTVTWQDRLKYAELVANFRLRQEVKAQIEAIRDGIYSIIPSRFFAIFKWNEIESLFCGTPHIDIEVLKKHTIYEGYTQNSREVKDFWDVLNDLTPQERCSYLRFVWGRSRLPTSEDGFTQPMKIQKLEKTHPDSYLPLSHTCFFSIELPSYSSKVIMKEKLLYAVTFCKAIDIDFTNTATEARNLQA